METLLLIHYVHYYKTDYHHYSTNSYYLILLIQTKFPSIAVFPVFEKSNAKMSNSPGKPIPYVPPQKPRGFTEKLCAVTKRLHLNYNMVTSLYMMEPMERAIISKPTNSTFHFYRIGKCFHFSNFHHLKLYLTFLFFRLYHDSNRHVNALFLMGVPSSLYLEAFSLHWSSNATGRK